MRNISNAKLKPGQIGQIYGYGFWGDSSADTDMDCCRKCGHFRFLHCPPADKVLRDAGYVYTQRCDPQTDHGCDCAEYVPEDNLEYLEWRYDSVRTKEVSSNSRRS